MDLTDQALINLGITALGHRLQIMFVPLHSFCLFFVVGRTLDTICYDLWLDRKAVNARIQHQKLLEEKEKVSTTSSRQQTSPTSTLTTSSSPLSATKRKSRTVNERANQHKRVFSSQMFRYFLCTDSDNVEITSGTNITVIDDIVTDDIVTDDIDVDDKRDESEQGAQATNIGHAVDDERVERTALAVALAIDRCTSSFASPTKALSEHRLCQVCRRCCSSVLNNYYSYFNY